ncbi:MAG: hypothetical protein A2Y40_00150 [Candidatus Margulisbacteria bacterium GWF2_35_9]|nr:MAG: hypothetical protein A2Y40_00150 [Candidatus Margulisbacteria bacterium GWF2_35_9]
MKFKNVWPYLLFFFIICSWPFIYYPLTDGDILHWLPIAKEIQSNFNFLTTVSFDQAHGPLLVWGSGIFAKVLFNSFYGYAFFNLALGVFGIWLTYYFSYKIWENESISKLASFIMSTSLAFVYFARTPMYDLPATVMYFAFTGFYLLYVIKNKRKYLLLALLFVGLGSLSRFSIVLGLSGIYLVSINIIYRRSIVKLITDGALVVLSPVLFNAPWLYGQYLVHGKEFMDTFMIDNFYRYIKEPGEGAKTYHNYYVFILYVFFGLIPHSFVVLISIFQKKTWSNIINNKVYQSLFAAFLPCLIVFSFSGHVKLGRYIAYVFPMLILFLSHHLFEFDLMNEKWRKKTLIATLSTLVLICITFGLLIYKFPKECSEAPLMVLGIIGVVCIPIITMFIIIRNNHEKFRENATAYLLPFLLVQLLFWSILAYESVHASFLTSIRDRVIQSIY